MFAVQYARYGDPTVLGVGDWPEPHAGPGSVRVRVLAASVNPIDRLLRAGVLKDVVPLPLPTIPGRDAVGIVDEIGDGVDDVTVGEKVFGLGGVSDTTAEYAILTAWAPVPHTWTDEQAAAAGLASATALRGLAALSPLADSILLIDGAAGAVGGAAAAFALADGAQVIGTAREHKHERLRQAGIIPVAYGDGLVERVRSAATRPVDAALDAAGAGSLAQLVEIVGDAGNVVTVADHQRAGELGVKSANAENDSALLRRAAELGGAGRYTPHVSEVFALRDAAAAHARSEAAGGKIVIAVAGSDDRNSAAGRWPEGRYQDGPA